MSKSRLIWKGEELLAEMTSRLSDAVVEIDLRIEEVAKQELYPGHGLVTGTLRRSIHAAEPGYNWGRDVRGGDMGGQPFEPEIRKFKITGVVGSGLVYAMPVHQGHHSFGGYHFITNAYNKVNPQVPGIVKKHAGK